MSRPVIRVENICKQYRLGTVSTGTISHDVNRWWHRLRGKEDPYLRIGETNDRTQKGASDYVWALKDLNFEVGQGEVLGIIGRNGAGKSTLLKILSRTTAPTTGQVKIKGRVSSLLEVGTGFHPELTGRENIFLNGAILGMTNGEIRRKFDEIVEFAGVERYVDTPVKRYSSGMYVRLAFAVAAHLEPDILIVDEVLAVGDAEFQKKALGKMKDVSNQDGRTVLFVSHNMSAIQNLCERLVYLSNGTVKQIGHTTTVINNYLSSKRQSKDDIYSMTERTGNGKLKFTIGYVKQINSDVLNTVDTFSDVEIELRFQVSNPLKSSWARIDIGINNLIGDRVGWLSSDTLAFNPDLMAGKIKFYIKNLPFAPGVYTCNLFCEINNEVADWVTEVMEFSVTEKDYYNTGRSIISNQGDVLLNYKVAQ